VRYVVFGDAAKLVRAEENVGDCEARERGSEEGQPAYVGGGVDSP
jgi:hypothetical protein